MSTSDGFSDTDRDRLHAARQPLTEAAVPSGAVIDALLAPDCVWHVARPVGALHGAAEVGEAWLGPLRRALGGFMRRGELALGGASRTGSGAWISWFGHYVGNLEASLLGVAPHGKLVF